MRISWILRHCTTIFCVASFFVFSKPLFSQQSESTVSSPRTNAPKSSLLLRWIDARGTVYPGASVTKMQWVWSKISPNDPFESPALRLWISSRLPKSWKPEKITGDNISLVEPYQMGETQSIVVDLRSGKARMRFDFIDGNNNPAEMTLSISVSTSRAYVLLNPNCGKNEIKFLTHKNSAKHLFVGLSCENTGDALDIYFFRSRDSKWNHGDKLVQFDSENRYPAFKFHADKPKAQVVYTEKLFRVGTLDEQDQPTEFSIYYSPKIPPPSFYFAAGLGITSYSYKETLNSVSLSQISPTAKVNAGYRLIPRVLDIAFNGFTNVFAITKSVTSSGTSTTSTSSSTSSSSANSLPSARFYGLNGRLGYRLPLALGATEFMFLTGWYFWGMAVADGSYGIKSLSGPQLFFTMINSAAGRAGWWFYTKFALISDGFKPTELQNRELAVGGGLELSARETKPISITLDIAQAAFTMADKSNGMTLLSITVGAQKSF